MNGNIQVEPTRVKLDKQGATSLKEEKTVDAIVRPQLTTILSSNLRYVQCCLSATEKFLNNFGDGGVGPPFGTLSSPTPPGQRVA